MLLGLSRDVLLFGLVTFGLGVPVTSFASRWSPLERLCVAVAAALTLMYGWAFGLYLTNAPLGGYWALPIAAAAIPLFRWRATVAFFAAPDVRRVVGLWGLLALWSLGLQALIVSYSGGGWAGDCWEHYDRARFFLQHWPRDTLFLGHYLLPARPPLANLDTSALLAVTDITFARYQVMTTLLGTLVFLPAALWVQNFGGGRCASVVLLLVFMTSPLFAANVTFPATKMETTFFVLTGLALLHRHRLSTTGRWARRVAWLALTAGLLAHYSAGPWIVAAAIALLASQGRELRTAAFWREQAVTAAWCSALLATWLGWSVHTYGWNGTVATNSTVVGAAHLSTGAELAMVARNIRNTVVPHPLRHFDKSDIAQPNRFGAVRDYFFNIYQVNVLFGCGLIGGLLLLYLLALRSRGSGETSARVFWWTLLPVAIVVGIAVNSQPDNWGQAQICLKPLALLGLAFLAARASTLSPVLRGVFVLGLAIDFTLGVVLQFGLESFLLNGWLEPGQTTAHYTSTLGLAAQLNFNAKEFLHLTFLGDEAAPKAAYVIGALGLVLVLALGLLWTERRCYPPAGAAETPRR